MGVPEEQPVVNIVGERVALGPIRRELIPTYHRWYNDFTMRRTFGGAVPWTVERQTKWYEAVAAAGSGEVMFTIYASANWQPLGTTTLTSIDYRSRTAEFGILIGDEENRGKGFGTETTQLMLDYAFTALGLHNVMLTVYEYNLAGRRVYEKAGFREIGRRRQAHWMGGRLWDEIYMDCLATEFTSPVLGRVFVPDTPR